MSFVMMSLPLTKLLQDEGLNKQEERVYHGLEKSSVLLEIRNLSWDHSESDLGTEHGKIEYDYICLLAGLCHSFPLVTPAHR